MPVDIAYELASGLSIVCATCTKYHRAKEQGLAKCLSKEECGSPLVGDTFHEYEGPITDFLKFCFVCGGDSKKAIAVKGHHRKIGVCMEHLDYVVKMAPKTPRRLPVLQRTYQSDGVERAVESLLNPKAPKTLGTLMAGLDAGTFKADNE